MDIENRVNTEDKSLSLPHRIDYQGTEYVKSKERNGFPVYYDAEDFILHAFTEKKVIEYEDEVENAIYRFEYIEHYPSVETPAYVRFEFSHDFMEDGKREQFYKDTVIVMHRLWTGWAKDLKLLEYQNPYQIFPHYYMGMSQDLSLPINNVAGAISTVFGLNQLTRVR